MQAITCMCVRPAWDKYGIPGGNPWLLPGSAGRVLGDLVLLGGDRLSDRLLAAGHARAYDGGAKAEGAWCSERERSVCPVDPIYPTDLGYISEGDTSPQTS